MGKTNPNFLYGVPELLLLQLLSRREMYGYELVKEIHLQSRESLTFGEGCIYPILHSLEEKKMIKSRRAETAGRTRTYYSLTDKGSQRLKELSKEWQNVGLAVASMLLVLPIKRENRSLHFCQPFRKFWGNEVHKRSMNKAYPSCKRLPRGSSQSRLSKNRFASILLPERSLTKCQCR